MFNKIKTVLGWIILGIAVLIVTAGGYFTIKANNYAVVKKIYTENIKPTMSKSTGTDKEDTQT